MPISLASIKQKFREVIAPLSPRERLVISFLLISGVIFLLSQNLIATNGEVGSIFRIPAQQCSAEEGWYSTEQASGQPSLSDSAQKDEFDSSNSAVWSGDAGDLQCIGFEANTKHVRSQSSIGLSLVAEQDSKAKQESRSESDLNLNKSSTEIIRVEGARDIKSPNQYGQDASVSLEGLFMVSVSNDGGKTWSPLHIIDRSLLTSTSTQMSIALPDAFSSDVNKLAVKVEPISSSGDNLAAWIDSIYVDYEVAEAQDINLAITDESGDKVEQEIPLLGQSTQINAELSSKDPDSGFWQGATNKVTGAVAGNYEPKISVATKITSSEGQVIVEQKTKTEYQGKKVSSDDVWTISTQMPANAKPGKYTLSTSVTDSTGGTQVITQDFMWGVLAINSDKTIYRSGETATFAITTLDEVGATICDGDITLKIEGPGQNSTYSTSEDTIKKSENCETYGPDFTPDYQTSHQLGGEGEYTMTLTAKTDNGEYTIEDKIEVKDNQPIYITRTGPTRVYPPETYPMKIEVKAEEYFKGTIEDIVPSSFRVKPGTDELKSYDSSEIKNSLNHLKWDVEIQAGESVTLGYNFEAPSVSPAFYLLGPAKAMVGEETKFEETRQWQIAGDAVGNMLLFWDGGAAPTGWTCVSCNPGDPFYQRFPRGAATYGGTGGAATHTHTATGAITATGNAAVTESVAGATVSNNTHGHNYTPTIGNGSNLPTYRQLNVIRYNTAGEPATLPTGTIAMFDSTVPAGWTRYSAQDGLYPRGENTAGTTGGANTHTHTISGNTSAATGAAIAPRTSGTQVAAATNTHTHSITSATGSVANEPPFTSVILGKINSAGVLPDNMLSMWNDQAPANWSDQSSSGNPFNNRFFKGSATFGTTGGATNHSHANVTGITSSGPVGTINRRQGTVGSSSTHTHTASVTAFSTNDHLPPYIDVFVAKKIPQPTLAQSAYRWFENSDSTDVGTPLAAQDAPATAPEQGTPFRLRALVDVTNNNLILNGRDFKLQYANRSGTCDTSFSGESYQDVATGSGAIRYHNNSSPSDGAALTSNANDPTHSGHANIEQTYEESNNFTNSQGIVAVGEDGMWDFSLIDNSASGGTTYCFRMVFSDDSPINTYSVIPQITTAARQVEQSAFRWFNNTDTADVGTVRAAQDAGMVAPAQGTPFRLRMNLHISGSQLPSSGENYKLQIAVSNGTCDVGFSGETYADVSSGSGAIRYHNNGTPADGTALTDNANDPVHSGHTNINQTYEESNNFTNSQAAISAGSDGLWDFSLVDFSSASDTSYCIRAVTSAGAVLDSYTNIPELTTAGVVLNQSSYRFFGNSNSTDVGAALAAQDTVADAPNQGTPFRLRMNLDVTSSSMGISALNFKLQYAQQSGTCDTSFTGEFYNDVETASGGIRYYDNATPSNGDALTDNANDPVHSGHANINQTYVESNDFTNSQGAVAIGQDGMWDFSLVDDSALSDTAYCFRIVRSSGATLGGYTVVAQITTTANVLEQSGYRFFENDNSEDVGDPLAGSNSAATAPYQGNAFRLRVNVHASDRNLDASVNAFKLQYATRSGTCDTGFSGEIYNDVATGSGAIRYYDNPTPTDGSNLIANANDPGHSGHNSVEQTYEEANNFTSTTDVTSGEDALWDFALVDDSAAPTTTYCLRIVYSNGATLDSYTQIPEFTTEITVGSMLLYYDDVSIPTGWSCVSCSPGDDFYQRFPRGESTYGATGGGATHTHTATGAVSATGNAAATENVAGATVATNAHGHTFTPTIGNGSNLPSYRQLKIIRRNASGPVDTLPTGAIGMFSSAVPSGWTRYSAQDGYYIRGEGTAATTGGSNTHNHTITGSTGAATGATMAPRLSGTQVGAASNTHTHTVSSTTGSVSNEPPYIETILGEINSTGATPTSLIAMWDDTLPSGWNSASESGGPFYQRFTKGTATYGGTGGIASHNHANVTGITSSAPVGVLNRRTGGVGSSSTHTHSVSVTAFSTNNHLPPYRDVIIASKSAPPNTASSLDQVRVTATTSMSAGDWTNETQVLFEAQASDNDNPDNLQLCVEAQPIGTPFSNFETSCGTGVAYSGSPINVSVTLTGLTNNEEYHWQARIKDGDDQYSAWSSFGGNAETARDFGIDTTAPTGQVFDGTNIGVDVDFNDGSLSQLPANWNIDFSDSGQSGNYEYSIGTTPGGTQALAWTSSALTTLTATSLTLNTSQPYYFNVRSTDNAGNQSVISSDGQFVAPSLSFSTSPTSVNIGELNAGNSFTSTAQTTLTTSTNAYNGYIVRGFAESLLESQNGDTIGMFSGGDYANPDEWLPGDTGYGYHSSDNLVNGLNRFNSGTCPGGGSPPCFAPWSLSFPGDIIADNTSLISGTPINNEQFTITHRVTTNSNQSSGQYRSTIIYGITARY